MYVDYDSALEMCGLQSLHMRREHRSLQFAIKCTKHQINKEMFPLNQSTDIHDIRTYPFLIVIYIRANDNMYMLSCT